MGVHHSKNKKMREHFKRGKEQSKRDKSKPSTTNIDPITTTNSTTTHTSFSVSDGSELNSDQNDTLPNDKCVEKNENSGGKDNDIVVSLRESSIFNRDGDVVPGISIDGVVLEDDFYTHCCLLCEAMSGERRYSLEVCGHGFCIPCIFAYSEEKLKDMPEDCCEILCPLESCGCVVSVADLKKALSVFGHHEDNKNGADLDNNIGEPSGSGSGKGVGVGVVGVVGSVGESSGTTLVKSSSTLPIRLTHSLELLLSKNTNYVHCPNPKCKFVFERLPPSPASRTREVVLDEYGNPISSVAVKHRQLNRFRCRTCDTNFCAACKTVPYHLGFTCKAYFLAKNSKHCRFCDAALPSNTKPHESCLKSSSSTHNNSKKLKSRSFLMLKWKSKEKFKPREKESKKGKSKGKDENIEELENDVEKDGIPQEFYVCNTAECKAKMKHSCQVFIDCGHYCRGTLDDFSGCMCLEPGCPSSNYNGDDYCSICWVESLKSAPSIKFACGHYFHYACVKQKLANKWPGPSISFSFATCPLCQAPISHNLFSSEISRVNILHQEVKMKGVERLKIEGLMEDPQITTEGSKFYNNAEDFAVHIFSFYECYLCKHPYFGGRRQCEVEAENVDMSKHNPAELICPGCSTINAQCSIHGREYIDFKCRFCCSLATYFCGGKAHFCTPCHDRAGQLVEFTNWSTIAKCTPCKGKAECPLGMLHADNGQEFAMGCSMCRAAQKLE